MRCTAWLLSLICALGAFACAEEMPEGLETALSGMEVLALEYYKEGTNGAAMALTEGEDGRELYVLETWRDMDWHVTAQNVLVRQGTTRINSDGPGRFCVQVTDETGQCSYAFSVRRSGKAWQVTGCRNEKNALAVETDGRRLIYRFDNGKEQRIAMVMDTALERFDFAAFPVTVVQAREIRWNTPAWGQFPLPEAVTELIEEKWPGWHIPYETVNGGIWIDVHNKRAYEFYENPQQGQAYVVLKRGSEKKLCVFEKNKKGVWCAAAVSETAVLQGADVPHIEMEGAREIVTVGYDMADPADDFEYTLERVDGKWVVSNFYKKGISEDERYMLAGLEGNRLIFADRENDGKRIKVKGKTLNSIEAFQAADFAETVKACREKLSQK